MRQGIWRWCALGLTFTLYLTTGIAATPALAQTSDEELNIETPSSTDYGKTISYGVSTHKKYIDSEGWYTFVLPVEGTISALDDKMGFRFAYSDKPVYCELGKTPNEAYSAYSAAELRAMMEQFHTVTSNDYEAGINQIGTVLTRTVESLGDGAGKLPMRAPVWEAKASGNAGPEGYVVVGVVAMPRGMIEAMCVGELAPAKAAMLSSLRAADGALLTPLASGAGNRADIYDVAEAPAGQRGKEIPTSGEKKRFVDDDGWYTAIYAGTTYTDATGMRYFDIPVQDGAIVTCAMSRNTTPNPVTLAQIQRLYLSTLHQPTNAYDVFANQQFEVQERDFVSLGTGTTITQPVRLATWSGHHRTVDTDVTLAITPVPKGYFIITCGGGTIAEEKAVLAETFRLGEGAL